MINETALKAATESAKAKTTDPRWLRAIDKAAAKLAAGELIVTLLANDALVTSENGTYRVNGHCTCPATVGHCYHRCAVRLVEMMESAPAAASTSVDEKETVINALKAAWNRKYASNRRYDLNYTVMSICGATELERAPLHYLKQLLRALPLAEV
jgi:hypothetical protein